MKFLEIFEFRRTTDESSLTGAGAAALTQAAAAPVRRVSSRMDRPENACHAGSLTIAGSCRSAGSALKKTYCSCLADSSSMKKAASAPERQAGTAKPATEAQSLIRRAQCLKEAVSASFSVAASAAEDASATGMTAA